VISHLHIRGFRSAHDVELELGPLTALVGEAGSGKSNLLAAIWKLLGPGAAALGSADATFGGSGDVHIEATLSGGERHELHAGPAQGQHRTDDDGRPHVLFLPASERGDGLLPGGLTDPTLTQALAHDPSPSLALLDAVSNWLDQGRRDLVLLIEEPELFLRPHRQRALYHLLRELAANDNQIVYSTHAATFLNVARLEEIALIDRAEGATHVRRPQPLPEGAEFRAVNEFDAERSELFLCRSAILVEGRTEKLVFPFLFRALGYDADLEAVSIVDCGGKPNLPVIAQVCNLTGIPYLVVHDRDAPPGRQPIESERILNQAIDAVAGPERTVELARDFEAVAKLRGHKRKPERALRWAEVTGADVPQQLADVVERAVAFARGA
jgi:putative ATP-dependent endonuclease of the OLD family